MTIEVFLRTWKPFRWGMGSRRTHTFFSTLYSHRKHQGLSSVCVWQSPGDEHFVQDHTGKDGMLLNLKKITVHGDTVLLGACLVLSMQTWFFVPLPHFSVCSTCFCCWFPGMQLYRSCRGGPCSVSQCGFQISVLQQSNLRSFLEVAQTQGLVVFIRRGREPGRYPLSASSLRIYPFPCKSCQGFGLILLSSHKFYLNLRLTANNTFLLCSIWDEQNVL